MSEIILLRDVDMNTIPYHQKTGLVDGEVLPIREIVGYTDLARGIVRSIVDIPSVIANNRINFFRVEITPDLNMRFAEEINGALPVSVYASATQMAGVYGMGEKKVRDIISECDEGLFLETFDTGNGVLYLTNRDNRKKIVKYSREPFFRKKVEEPDFPESDLEKSL
ncbi:hypothetical protein GOV05_02230 [Candidatus Woesearchaeota archaeon]|nr:hypothetical protein [Candidatus Woesearchaeota archaeon]